MKYKVYVYAICKNEAKFVNRWADALQEADGIYVLDTGSTDNTVELLKARGIHVETEIFNPWRFDKARNRSLELVPDDADICVCLDLDEVIEPGWRDELEQNWENGMTAISYNYNWSLDENNKPIISFYIEKIHARHSYKWTHPVHEVLTYIGEKEEKKKCVPTITVNHYPDNTKSRGSYLPLLELSVKEDPDDDRNMHYLGREYMYYGKYQESIDTLIKHLHLPKAIWKDERCASMRFIGRCYTRLGRFDEAKMWYEKAKLEAPHLRDAFVELALLNYHLKEWDEVIKNCNLALKIKSHYKSYINEQFSWNETVYDLLAIAYYNTGDYNKSLENIKIALTYNPDDERLKGNYQIILDKANKK